MIKEKTKINLFKKQIDDFLEGIRKETGIPGICIAMNIDGQNVFATSGTIETNNKEKINIESRFQLGCITKLLTALLAAEMIENGKLDFEAPLEQYLEELRGTRKGKDITMWHLLSHTSGYRGLNISEPGIAYYFSWKKFIEFFNKTPQLFKPGSVFSYEHSEYVILGEIIERISGRNIKDLFQEMIIEPMNITTGSIKNDQNNKDNFVADHTYNTQTRQFKKLKSISFGDFWKASLSDITMSAQDLLRIANTICGITDVPKSFSKAATIFIQKQVIKLPNTFGSTRHEQIPMTFGIGCAAYRGWLLGHNGSARGQTCGIRFDPRKKIAMVVNMNAWQPFIRDSIINHFFGALRGEAISQPSEKLFELSLNDLHGTYLGPQGQEIVVSIMDNQITCNINIPNAPTVSILMKKDENGILQVCSDTLHYSLGFFEEPESGYKGIMLGLSAFRKKRT